MRVVRGRRGNEGPVARRREVARGDRRRERSSDTVESAEAHGAASGTVWSGKRVLLVLRRWALEEGRRRGMLCEGVRSCRLVLVLIEGCETVIETLGRPVVETNLRTS